MKNRKEQVTQIIATAATRAITSVPNDKILWRAIDAECAQTINLEYYCTGKEVVIFNLDLVLKMLRALQKVL